MVYRKRKTGRKSYRKKIVRRRRTMKKIVKFRKSPYDRDCEYLKTTNYFPLTVYSPNAMSTADNVSM